MQTVLHYLHILNSTGQITNPNTNLLNFGKTRLNDDFNNIKFIIFLQVYKFLKLTLKLEPILPDSSFGILRLLKSHFLLLILISKQSTLKPYCTPF